MAPENGEKDAFVRATALIRSGLSVLMEGQKVSFQYGQGKNGLEVQSIRLVQAAIDRPWPKLPSYKRKARCREEVAAGSIFEYGAGGGAPHSVSASIWEESRWPTAR
ncbi:cold-shock protein [Mesorhizobium cantuariense]|uniref:Cold-shock protein n=1 Tax=Mesorhizobium cantuariense TaxID=1300275 RepID=A0ABV7MGL0_9HYPH